MLVQLQRWWDLQRLRFAHRNADEQALSFGELIGAARRILICLPWDFREFRVARYVMKFFPAEAGERQVTYFLPEEFSGDLPIRSQDTIMAVERDVRTSGGEFPVEILERLADEKFDAAVDMNTRLDLGVARLIQESGAPLRIGFGGRYSTLFYNVEIQRPDEHFILERAYRDMQQLVGLEK